MEQRKRTGFARNVARKLLRKHWDGNVPVDIRAIATAEGFTVKEINIEDSLSGTLIRELKAVGINRNHPLVRKRFSLGHELGHYFLGHPSEIEMEESDEKDAFEQEANEFAAEILMPYSHIKQAIKEHKDIEQLAKMYLVSTSAITLRLMKCKLLSVYESYTNPSGKAV